MKKFCCAILAAALLLSGCDAKEINSASIPLGMGVDYQDHNFIFTTQLAQPASPEKGGGEGPQYAVLSANGKTVSEAARKIMLSFPNQPFWSHTNLLLVGDNLARTDMALLMDYITRNRFFRKSMPVVIAHQATPEQILNTKPLLVPYTATAIKDILQSQEAQAGIYTPVTLIELIDRFAVPGIEAVVPMVMIGKNEDQETIKIEGMAVFRGQQMVGTLNEIESRGYRFMRSKMIQGGLFVIPSPTDKGKWITVELSRSQAKISPVIQDHEIKMKIKVTGEGNFYEQQGTGNLLTPQGINELEQSSNQEIEKQISACIRKAQTLNSDIFGWGQLIRNADPKLWKEIEPDWDEIFPTIKSQINVKFSIRRSYLTDQSFVFRE